MIESEAMDWEKRTFDFYGYKSTAQMISRLSPSPVSSPPPPPFNPHGATDRTYESCMQNPILLARGRSTRVGKLTHSAPPRPAPPYGTLLISSNSIEKSGR